MYLNCQTKNRFELGYCIREIIYLLKNVFFQLQEVVVIWILQLCFYHLIFFYNAIELVPELKLKMFIHLLPFDILNFHERCSLTIR